MTDSLKLETRETAFTDAEFASLPRNSDGDIIDFGMAAVFITDKQREKLTGDDSSRMEEHDEEIRHMMAEFRAELGL